jgi:myosin heavy subunit
MPTPPPPHPLQDIVDFIVKRPVGILPLLDNQTLLGERGTDAAFATSIKREWGSGKSPALREEVGQPADTFIVNHFAASVPYSATGFVARNNDALHHDLASVPGASDFDLLKDLFEGPAPTAHPTLASTPSVDAAASPAGAASEPPSPAGTACACNYVVVATWGAVLRGGVCA